MNILAIIPARSGSKSVPHKNMRLLAGKPMLAYSLEHANQSKYINRIILDTDSEVYAEAGKGFGAEIPYLRPAELAGDTSLDIDVFYHCLSWLKEREGYIADLVVQLRPTYPIRNITDVDNMIEILLENKIYDSARTIAPAKEIPYKMWHRSETGMITPVIQDMGECYNMPRQELPKVYYQNACIDVVRGSVILEKKSMTGTNIYGYLMEKNYDIDTEEELAAAAAYLELRNGGKKLVVDIDGVIARLQPENKYDAALPNEEFIRIINQLYDYGNEIVLFTARGYVTGLDWGKTTEEQLIRWGVHYHSLHFGKPNADYYIDDRMLGMEKLIDYFGII